MKWLRRVLDNSSPATDVHAEVEAVEKHFGVKLPLDYLSIARKNHGALPMSNGFDIPSINYDSDVEYLYHVRQIKPLDLQHVITNFACGLSPKSIRIAAVLDGDLVY